VRTTEISAAADSLNSPVYYTVGQRLGDLWKSLNLNADGIFGMDTLLKTQLELPTLSGYLLVSEFGLRLGRVDQTASYRTLDRTRMRVVTCYPPR
jgi:hypothetical protein